MVRKYRSNADYLVCFKGSTIEHLAVGEASPLYLYSDVAIDNILKFNSVARFIVMLRNPVDLVYSLHSEFVYAGHEDQTDFEQAWRLQEQRRNGHALPSCHVESKILLYGEVGKLGAQLAKLFSKVDSSRVHVIFFDEFTANTRKIYQETLQFLNVPDNGRSEFPVINQNKKLRSSLLHKLLTRLDHSYLVRMPVLWTKRMFRISSFGLTRRMLLVNARHYKRPPLTDLLRKELEHYFAEDQKLLCSLVTPPSTRD